MTPQKRKGLGRGLEALLSGDNSDPFAKGREDIPATVPLAQLQAGKYQPRTRMDQASLSELADSIKAQGILQPVLVRRIGGHGPTQHYEIIAGERRFCAAKLAGLTEVPVVIRDVPDSAALAMALIENIQREDLNPLEEAQGIARLVREFDLTQEAAAQAVGRSRSATANLLRLLQLPKPVQEMLHDGRLDMGHARALLALEGVDQIALANTAAERAWSVRVTEDAVRRKLEAGRTGTARVKASRSRDLVRFEEDLAERLGTRVDIAPGKKGGKLTIHYASNEHLGDLLDLMRK